MSDTRHSRFNGHYLYLFKSTDFFGGTCYGKGSLDVRDAKSKGTVEIDSTKPNSWYCYDTKIDFQFETEVQNPHEVMFSMNLFGGSIRSRAKFDQPVNQAENTFETKIFNGAYQVTGKIKRQPDVQDNELTDKSSVDTCPSSRQG